MTGHTLPAVWVATTGIVVVTWDMLMLIIGAGLAGAADLLLRVVDSSGDAVDDGTCDRHRTPGCDCDTDPVVW